MFEALTGKLSLNSRDFGRGLRQSGSKAQAFGATASGAFERVGDSAAEAGRKARIAGSGVSELASDVRSVVTPSFLAASALDEAGDEAAQAGRKAAIASTAFGTLSLTTSGLSASVGILTTSVTSLTTAIVGLTLVLTPLLAAFSALALGAAGIAVAFGAIIGSGIVAWGKGFTKALKQTAKEIKKLVSAFGQQFVPLLKDAVAALPTLVKSILKAIGPLGKFKKALRDLGQFALKAIPALVGWIVDLGRWALPIFRKLAGIVMSSVVPALQSFVSMGKAYVGYFSIFLSKLAKALPSLDKFGSALGALSFEFVDLVTNTILFAAKLSSILMPAIVGIIRFIERGLQAFNQFAGSLTDAMLSSQKFGKELGVLAPLLNSLKRLVGVSARVVGVLATEFVKVGKAIITNLKPYLPLVIRGLSRVVKAVTKGLKAFLKFNRRVGGVGTALVKLAGKISPLIPSIRTLRRLFNTAKNKVKALHSKLLILVSSVKTIRKQFGKVVTKAKRLRKKFQTLNVTTGKIAKTIGGAGLAGAAIALASAFRGPLLTAIMPIARIVGGSLLSAFSSVALTVGGSLIGSLLSLGGTLVGLLPSLGLVGGALSALLSPLVLLVGAVAALYAAWKVNFLNIRGITKTVVGGILALISGDMSKARKKFGKAGRLMQKSWNKNIKPILGSAKQIFSTLRRVISDAMNWIHKNAIQPALRAIRDLWRTHSSHIMEDVRQLMSFVKTTIKVVIGAVLVIWRKFGDEILAYTRFTFDLIGSIIGGVLDGILTTVDIITDLLVGDWEGALKALKGLGKRIFNGILGFIEKWGSGLLRVVSNIFDDIIHYIKNDFWGDLTSVISDATFAAWQLFYDFGSDIYNTIVGFLDDIVNYILHGFWGDLVGAAKSAAEAGAKALRQGFNAIIPDIIKIPEVTLGGYNLPGPLPALPQVTIGGQTIDIPELAVGGRVTDSGWAKIHEGETITPANVETPYRPDSSGGGSGEQEVHVTLSVEGDSPLADEIARHVEANEQQKIDGANRGMIDRTDYLG